MIDVQSKEGRVHLNVEGKRSEVISDLACITLAVLREIGGMGPYFEYLRDLTAKVFIKWLVEDDEEEVEEA